jgi:hypothetical protein
MSKNLFLCGTTHGQQLPTFTGADKFDKALQLLLARGVGAVLEEWDHYGNVVLKSTTRRYAKSKKSIGKNWAFRMTHPHSETRCLILHFPQS